MNLLTEIIAHKRQEFGRARIEIGIAKLQAMPLYAAPRKSLSAQVEKNNQGFIIAEFKRRSPSKPQFAYKHLLAQTVKSYQLAGASAISILTDNKFFGGELDDLANARLNCSLPLLRKDFILDSYQLHEARAYGADIVLLIAAILKPQELQQLNEHAQELGLETLIEIHSREDLELCQQAKVKPSFFGINNRSLNSLKVDCEISSNLINELPESIPIISESGLTSASQLNQLLNIGVSGFLIGTHFLDQPDPGTSCREMLHELRNGLRI